MHSGEQPILNSESSLERLKGDRDFLHLLYQVFLEDLPSKLSALDSAIREGDLSALHRAAHSLKGACATIGADKLQHASHALETMPEATDQLTPALEKLKQRADEVASAIQQEIKK